MSSTLRCISKHARVVAQRSRPTASVPARSFHSPFHVLNNSASTSPLTTAPSKETDTTSYYEKQHDHSTEPIFHSGNQTYVVSEPDPANAPYAVPSGAYPTSAPYVNFTPTEAPEPTNPSSTSSQPAHPATTRNVPHNESGVGESAAVRNAEAPGAMGKRGGGYGGLRMMNSSDTKQEGSLADRNPQPNAADVAEKFSKAGVDEAWKLRK